MNAVELDDWTLEEDARRAAKAHDSEKFAPLLDEILRRAIPVDTRALFNDLWPPVGYGAYVSVRPKNAPKRGTR